VTLSENTLSIVRRILLLALVLGNAGLGVELLLLEHFENVWQTVPLVLIGCALVVLAWHAVDRRAAPVRTLQLLMVLFLAAGGIGMALHYQGNVEFELEMYPSRSGFELFRESMMGATPALAPGTMIQLALVGLAYAYRHPRLTRHDGSLT
jgi:hypothetical protein